MSFPITQSIPFIAGASTWEAWNGNMLHYFGEEPLPRVDEENWPEFARAMSGLSTFSVYSLPDPDGFASWQDWASVVIGAVNGPTE